MTDSKKTRQTRASVTSATSTTTRKPPSARSAAGSAVKNPGKAAAEATTSLAPGVAKAKAKLVRDSFTIPKSEYAVLEGLKLRAEKLTRPAKKSELLRAGIAVLSGMNDRAFLAALNGVPSLKTGRPKSGAASAE